MAQVSSTPTDETSRLETAPLSKGASLAEQTYEFLKGLILTVKIKPGAPLMENQLAKQLGISRSPLREAMARLEKEGHIEIVPWRGARVADITPRYVTELYQVRSSLEGLAAHLATGRIDRDVLQRMKVEMEQLGARIRAGDLTAFYEHEVVFHNLYVCNCENELLISTLSGLRDHLTRVRNYLSYVWTIPGHAEISFREHEAILDSFIANSPDAA